MNIVFLGSAKFAVPSLEALAQLHKISCVVTQPDKEKGRGLHLEPTVIKSEALNLGLKLYQPASINKTDAVVFLKELKPDLFVVVAYGQILSEKILHIPRIFSINAHASLLPQYRGAAPINWAIINGQSDTGVSIIKMEKTMDTGPIILQKSAKISQTDTAISLENKLAGVAAQLLIAAVGAIVNNDYKLNLQGEKNVTFAPRLKKEDGEIDWKKAAKDIFNLIRGTLPWPGAFTYYRGRLLKIYKAKVISSLGNEVTMLAGRVIQVRKEGIIVATGKDNLIIEELQIEGRRKMSAEEFIAGHKIQQGEIFQKRVA